MLYSLNYIDDIILTGTTLHLIHDLITMLHDKVSQKKLGVPKYLLGFELCYQSNGCVLLIQSKYIKNLMNIVNMSGENGVTISMFSHYKLSIHGSNVPPDPAMYRSIRTALQYVTLTLSNILCVNK